MLLTLLVFLFILSILVLVHEFGHFLTAKRLGIKVEEFGIGLPPRLWGIQKGETIYSLNALPIGGFIKLYGEEEEEFRSENQPKTRLDLEKAFFSRPAWQRGLVLSAGVLMNFFLGWIVISALFTQGVMVLVDRVHLEKVVEDSPAQKVGLWQGDIIDQINGVKIKKSDDLAEYTKKHLGEEVTLTVQRSEKDFPTKFQTLAIKIVPRIEYPKDQGPMGIVISNFEEKKYPLSQAPLLGIKHAFKLSWALIKGIALTLWQLLTFQTVEADVAGPVGIAQITGQAVKFGKLAVFELLGLLSINLAIINFLPFPALDGGRFLFVILEVTTGKKLRPRWERITHQIGMAFLLSLIALVTIHDILRILGRQ